MITEELKISLVSSVSPLLTRRRVNRGQSCMKKAPRIRIDKNNCWRWLWTVAPCGYAKLSRGGKNYTVSRLVYELLVGKIPHGLCIDHLCRVRDCVNPFHLEAVTNKENVLRGVGLTSINSKKTHCKRGHKFTKENTKYSNGGKNRACRKCSWINYKTFRLRKKAFLSSLIPNQPDHD